MTQPNNQSLDGVTAPGGRAANEVTSETPSVGNWVRPKDLLMHHMPEITSRREDYEKRNRKTLVSRPLPPYFQQMIDRVEAVKERNAATGQIMVNIPSNPHWPGFLSLPSEIRIMIYRHMFHWPVVISLSNLRSSIPGRSETKPVPPLLATCKLIYKEAFEVLWGENCYIWPGSPHPPLLPSIYQRIVDTIQKLEVNLAPRAGSPAYLIKLIREFGNSTMIRGVLDVKFSLYSPRFFDKKILGRYLTCLSAFTNFKVISIQFRYNYKPLFLDSHPFQWTAEALQPRLGLAKHLADNCTLQFHPQDHLNLQRSQQVVDWMDLLDGIRLD